MWEKITFNENPFIRGIIVFILLFGIACYAIITNNNSLKSHKGYTTGTILDLEFYTKSNILKYHYKAKATSKDGYGDAVSSVKWDSLIGKKFPIIYDTTARYNSRMLIFPEDFAWAGLAFPDSLRWVLKFNKNSSNKK